MAKIRSRSALAATLSAVVLLLSYAFVHLLSAPPSIFSPPVTLTVDYAAPFTTSRNVAGAVQRWYSPTAVGDLTLTQVVGPLTTVTRGFTDPGAVAWTENGEAMLLIRSTEEPQPSTAAVIAIADSSP